MELINVRDNHRMSHFYGAARSGDAETLVQLLRRDASILANIPDGLQTPLHISALLGHVPFTVALLNHDRKHGNLAIRGDSSGRTALHLASTEGHIEIVRELLHANNQPCLVRDEEGRIPLHYAVMRGRTEVVRELIMARPESLRLGDREQSTVFHLCVTYNHLETLETLVKLEYVTANITAGQPRGTIFMGPDRVGNTILHLAIIFKRVEVAWYLLSVPEIRELEKAQNRAGLTAHDILQCSSKDLKMDEIKLMLTKKDDDGTEESNTREMEVINVGGAMENLYRAAWRGDQRTLEQLLQRDATILANISDRRQTPLHISAMLGHAGFTKVILNRERDLAIRGDSSGRTALHLASTEGHIEIVRQLLHVNNQPCLKRDDKGRIPLHYAAMRGRTEVVRELIMASPNSLSFGDAEESNVFHSCVVHNHLNTLKTLVKLDYVTAASEPRRPIFMRPNQNGNTILHLAIMLKRVEVVSYLLSVPEIREMANLKNEIGSTAHDILREQGPKDLKICEIQHMMTKVKSERNFCGKIIRDWLKHGDEWLEEMRENLSLVSTVIATITFQALINPPGGFIQQGLSSSSKENTTSSNEVIHNVTSSYDPLNCTILPDNNTHCPGQAMASSSHFHPYFEKYLLYVTISFISSLIVTLLLVSGIFPMKNKAVIWMLSVGMCITLTSLAAAYFAAMSIIIPSRLLHQKFISDLKINAYFVVWYGLFGLVLFLVAMRFFTWVDKKIKISWRQSQSRGLLFGLFWTFVLLAVSVPMYLLWLTSSIFVT